MARVVRTKQTNSEYPKYSTRVTCAKSNYFRIIAPLTIHYFWSFRSIRSLEFVGTVAGLVVRLAAFFAKTLAMP